MEGTLSTKEVELRAGEIIALRVKPEDGFDAQVLGVILDIPKMAGEDYTDGECLDLILKVSAHWCNLTGGSAWIIP
jgi:hypothetical protein